MEKREAARAVPQACAQEGRWRPGGSQSKAMSFCGAIGCGRAKPAACSAALAGEMPRESLALASASSTSRLRATSFNSCSGHVDVRSSSRASTAHVDNPAGSRRTTQNSAWLPIALARTSSIGDPGPSTMVVDAPTNQEPQG